MSRQHHVLLRVAEHAMSGKGAHIELRHVVEGLDWKSAGMRPGGVPHSVFQLLNHVVYWHEWALRWLGGRRPPEPRHASGSWPGAEAPSSSREWQLAVQRLLRVLDQLKADSADTDLLSARGRKTALEMLQTVGAHGSYHAGQVALVRQMLGKWPPPSGGLTW